ncbi:FTR1 family iron permease [Vibrio taketomensis]|uniref:FTR1 family iron permease n=1 Tax=Vibrio taketomensis TaxID=2572923 RepID=UPI00138A1FC1|nr:FTR1 family protein [Vibrio taketomensis]
MGQVAFVIWRESIEALLLISIIFAWIKQNDDSQQGMKYLWYGVGFGCGVSVLLASAIYGVFNILGDTEQSIFMIGMEFIACILIVQMVCWMNSRGRMLKSELESGLSEQTKHRSWWGVTLIVAIAIAREGSEIVVFLSSFIMTLNSNNAAEFFTEVFAGIALAALTIYLFSLFKRFIPWKIFFNITGIILLFLALSLLLRGVEESINLLIEYDYSVPDFLYLPAWNTTAIIDDSTVFGNLLASFFAYRSQPIWLSVITFVLYWIAVGSLMVFGGKNEQQN